MKFQQLDSMTTKLLKYLARRFGKYLKWKQMTNIALKARSQKCSDTNWDLKNLVQKQKENDFCT